MKQVVGAVIMPFETNLNLRIDEALMRRPRPLAWSATQPRQHDYCGATTTDEDANDR
jgi:hypothetical protein